MHLASPLPPARRVFRGSSGDVMSPQCCPVTARANKMKVTVEISTRILLIVFKMHTNLKISSEFHLDVTSTFPTRPVCAGRMKAQFQGKKSKNQYFKP